jgi:hypothetical protein
VGPPVGTLLAQQGFTSRANQSLSNQPQGLVARFLVIEHGMEGNPASDASISFALGVANFSAVIMLQVLPLVQLWDTLTYVPNT